MKYREYALLLARDMIDISMYNRKDFQLLRARHSSADLVEEGFAIKRISFIAQPS